MLKRYFLEGWALRQLAVLAGCTLQTVKHQLDWLLISPPLTLNLEPRDALILNASWNHRRWCLFLYRNQQGKNLLGV